MNVCVTLHVWFGLLSSTNYKVEFQLFEAMGKRIRRIGLKQVKVQVDYQIYMRKWLTKGLTSGVFTFPPSIFSVYY